METVLERTLPTTGSPALLPAIRELDEAAARRTLREQIARLEAQLGALFCSAFPRTGIRWEVPGMGGGPRLLSLAELEEVRDRLADRVAVARRELDARTAVEEQKRRLIEEMLVDPAAHRWVVVSNADIGEPGCKHWHARPHLGLLGMLMGWWRVRISSGCPLAGGTRPSASPPRGRRYAELP